MEALRALIQQLLGIWKELGLNQKVTVVVSGVVMLIGLAVVVFYTSRAEYTLLYGGLDSSQAGKVTAALDEQSVPYRVGAGGNSIYVPREQVYKMRMQLAPKASPRHLAWVTKFLISKRLECRTLCKGPTIAGRCKESCHGPSHRWRAWKARG